MICVKKCVGPKISEEMNILNSAITKQWLLKQSLVNELLLKIPEKYQYWLATHLKKWVGPEAYPWKNAWYSGQYQSRTPTSNSRRRRLAILTSAAAARRVSLTGGGGVKKSAAAWRGLTYLLVTYLFQIKVIPHIFLSKASQPSLIDLIWCIKNIAKQSYKLPIL